MKCAELLRLCLASVAIAAASQAATAASAIDSFVYVASDAALKSVGMTREQYNLKTPAAEKRWREAWAAQGTKQDNRELANIRQLTTKPADMATNPGQDTPAPAPRKAL